MTVPRCTCPATPHPCTCLPASGAGEELAPPPRAATRVRRVYQWDCPHCGTEHTETDWYAKVHCCACRTLVVLEPATE